MSVVIWNEPELDRSMCIGCRQCYWRWHWHWQFSGVTSVAERRHIGLFVTRCGLVKAVALRLKVVQSRRLHPIGTALARVPWVTSLFDWYGLCSAFSQDKIQNKGKSAPFKGGRTFTSTFRGPFYRSDGTHSFKFLTYLLSNPLLSTFSMFIASKVLTRRLG